jgi:hypothetical protein
MILLDILFNKPYFVKDDGTMVVDLTLSSVRYTNYPEMKSLQYVDQDMTMRPDLVSSAIYGDQSKFDHILKYNSISNPFSLDENRPLMIPDMYDMASQFVKPAKDSNSLDIRKPGLKDRAKNVKLFPGVEKPSRIEFLKKKAESTQKRLSGKSDPGTILPPNVNRPGAQNIKFVDGNIIFGEDVTAVSKKNCPEVLSATIIKEKLMSQKISGA